MEFVCACSYKWATVKNEVIVEGKVFVI